MTQPKANMYIHLFIPLLQKTLKRLGELPARKASQVKELLKNYADVLHAGTERPIQRPSDAERAKEHYSGKKTHGLKNNVLTLPNLRIVWMSQTYEGKIHDKTICDKENLLFPKGIRLWQDGGFLGYTPENVIIKMPARKPRGRDLSLAQKQQNKEISSFRVKVEHAIGGVKTFRIVKERYRCHKLFFDDLVFEMTLLQRLFVDIQPISHIVDLC
jgi:hypothetical protein